MIWSPGDLVEIETVRFLVRSIEREDVTESLLSWMADPEVMTGLNLPERRMSQAQALRWAMGFDNARQFFLLVCDRATGTPIGFFTVTIDSHKTAETAVVIGDRNYWGKNVVMETRAALLDFLFDTLGIYKVIGRPHGRNLSSIYNYNAMGFTCEAILRAQMLSVVDNDRLDQLVYGILAPEWVEKRKGTG
ncbi:GNAT family protein [uncultured Roseobacter sp.]|uniref:GNAT family N-acetyltransferase n=1 Tax=uncultured Roseobacter sp. TaxID=114847 RepID=UPI002615DFFF|nr:GNAT family protein [uncultured Roseobacter sp.]